jgi:hypothetical protein
VRADDDNFVRSRPSQDFRFQVETGLALDLEAKPVHLEPAP